MRRRLRPPVPSGAPKAPSGVWTWPGVRPKGALTLLSCLLAASGAAGCGSTEVAGDVVPKTTPELTPPSVELGRAPASAADGTGATGASGSTGATGTGSASGDADPPSSSTPAPSGGGTAAPVTPAPATPATPAPAAPTPATGGAGDGTDPTPDAKPGGGVKANPGGASPGGLSDFCAQNPGACGQ